MPALLPSGFSPLLRNVSSKEAFAIATSFDRTVYDSVYAALAVVMKGHLITADERLANALAAYLPVKWLGAV